MANYIYLEFVPERIDSVFNTPFQLGIWIGMTLADAANPFNSSKYWIDQANRY